MASPLLDNPAWLGVWALLVVAPVIAVRRHPGVVTRHGGLVLASLAVISLAAVAALVRLDPPSVRMSLDPSEEPMLPAEDPAREVYHRAVATFGDDDLFIVGMRTPDVFTSERLAVLRRLGDEIRRIPGVRRIRSLVDAIDYRYDAETDTMTVGELIDEIPTDVAALQALKARTIDDPLFRGSIVSGDGRTAAVNVSFRPMTDGEFVAAGIDDRIAALVEAAAADDRDLFVTGRQHIKARAHRIMVDDLLLLIPVAVGVGATIAWVVAGSLASAVLPVGTSLVATLWVFGLLACLDHPLNLITLVLGPTLICVGSVYGVHVLSIHANHLARGKAPGEAAVAAVEEGTDPVVIAGVTTCAGFAALALSDTPAVQDLGLFCLLGVAAATMLSLTGLPALLARLERAAVLRDPGRPALVLSGLLAATAGLVHRRPTALLVAWGLGTATALAFLPRIVVDSDYVSFFDSASDVRRDFRSVSDHLVGAVPLYVAVDGGDEGAFREPDNLRALAKVQEAIGRLDNVSSTTSVVDLVRKANRMLEKGDPRAWRIPDSRGEVADILFLVPKNDLRRFASSNHSQANIVVRTGQSGSAAILALERSLREVLDAQDLPPSLHAEVTGNTILVNHGAEGIARNQLSTVTAATLTILLIVSRAFASVRVGALAMIPNLVPVVVFFGILGSGVATLSLPTSLISCIALGIAIDDTAHFLIGYRRRRQGGMGPEAAVTDCILVLGRPIVTTSLMLIGGFLVLSFSGFATLRQFGHLTALTMLICCAADLLLLPAILLRARA